MENTPKKTFFEKILDWIRSLFFNKELELTILGLQNAGKSTFVNVLSTGKFEDDQIPTIGFNFRKLKKGKVEFKDAVPGEVKIVATSPNGKSNELSGINLIGIIDKQAPKITFTQTKKNNTVEVIYKSDEKWTELY